VTAARALSGVGRLIVETLAHTVLFPGTVIVGLPYLIVSSGPELHALGLGRLRWLGILPIVVGAAIGTWCTWDFVFSGQGTPNPLDPPKVLVARGPYRLVRNPMYVSVGFILAGEALFFGSLGLVVYATVVVVLFHFFVLSYEEPALRKLFGASYESYCRTVPRWIPGGR
jgi:protein-S-isoprenylcysteine O-methyltransferase Ste14